MLDVMHRLNHARVVATSQVVTRQMARVMCHPGVVGIANCEADLDPNAEQGSITILWQLRNAVKKH